MPDNIRFQTVKEIIRDEGALPAGTIFHTDETPHEAEFVKHHVGRGNINPTVEIIGHAVNGQNASCFATRETLVAALADLDALEGS